MYPAEAGFPVSPALIGDGLFQRCYGQDFC